MILSTPHRLSLRRTLYGSCETSPCNNRLYQHPRLAAQCTNRRCIRLQCQCMVRTATYTCHRSQRGPWNEMNMGRRAQDSGGYCSICGYHFAGCCNVITKDQGSPGQGKYNLKLGPSVCRSRVTPGVLFESYQLIIPALGRV